MKWGNFDPATGGGEVTGGRQVCAERLSDADRRVERVSVEAAAPLKKRTLRFSLQLCRVKQTLSPKLDMRDWRGEVPHQSVCVVRTRPVIPDEAPDPLQFAQIGLANATFKDRGSRIEVTQRSIRDGSSAGDAPFSAKWRAAKTPVTSIGCMGRCC